jgi:hypothetical protein
MVRYSECVVLWIEEVLVNTAAIRPGVHLASEWLQTVARESIGKLFLNVFLDRNFFTPPYLNNVSSVQLLPSPFPRLHRVFPLIPLPGLL